MTDTTLSDPDNNGVRMAPRAPVSSDPVDRRGNPVRSNVSPGGAFVAMLTGLGGARRTDRPTWSCLYATAEEDSAWVTHEVRHELLLTLSNCLHRYSQVFEGFELLEAGAIVEWACAAGSGELVDRHSSDPGCVDTHESSSRSDRLPPVDPTSRGSVPTVEERRAPGVVVTVPGADGDVRIEVA